MPALFTLLSLVLVQPQTSSLAGVWMVHVDAARQSTPDGGSRSRSALDLELALEARGEDVTGRFKSVVGGSVTLTGTWRDGKLDLASPWRDVTVTNNGQPSTARVRWVIKGGLKDGVLGGTWDFQMGDSTLPQRWTGRRK